MLSPEAPHNRGKGLLFSRWGTRDLANARFDVAEGWVQSSEESGDFIGARRSYDWGAGDYQVRFAQDGLDEQGQWFGIWITDLATDDTTWIGSLRFPLQEGESLIKPSSYSANEIYGKKIRPVALHPLRPGLQLMQAVGHDGISGPQDCHPGSYYKAPAQEPQGEGCQLREFGSVHCSTSRTGCTWCRP